MAKPGKKEVDIMEFRKDLFSRAQERLDEMDRRNKEQEEKGAKAFKPGSGGTGASSRGSSNVAKQELLLNQDKIFIDSIDKLLKTTKQEADLEEKLKEAEAKNKELEKILEQLETEEDTDG